MSREPLLVRARDGLWYSPDERGRPVSPRRYERRGGYWYLVAGGKSSLRYDERGEAVRSTSTQHRSGARVNKQRGTTYVQPRTGKERLHADGGAPRKPSRAQRVTQAKRKRTGVVTKTTGVWDAVQKSHWWFGERKR